MNTMRILGNSPIPNQIVMSGIQARGGIGRITSNITPMVALKYRFHPISTPKIIPKKQDRPTAIPTRRRLSRICVPSGILPSGLAKSLLNRSHVAAGPGNRSGRLVETANHASMRTPIETTGSSRYIAFCHGVFCKSLFIIVLPSNVPDVSPAR